MTNTISPQTNSPLGLVCEKTEEQEIFDALVELWVDNKITYKTMIKYAPALDINLWKSFFTWVANW